MTRPLRLLKKTNDRMGTHDVYNPNVPKDLFDDMVLKMGVPALLRHAAEAHERETAQLKCELTDLRKLLATAAAAAVAELKADPTAFRTSGGGPSWKTPTSLEADESSRGADYSTSPRTRVSWAVKTMSQGGSIRFPPTKEVDESKYVQEANDVGQLAKLNEQISRLEEVQKDQSAKQLAEISQIKSRQILQQAALERVSEEAESSRNRRGSPSPSVLSNVSRGTDRQERRSVAGSARWNPMISTVRSNGSSCVGSVAMPVGSARSVGSEQSPETIQRMASMGILSYEEAFQPAPYSNMPALDASPSAVSVAESTSTSGQGAAVGETLSSNPTSPIAVSSAPLPAGTAALKFNQVSPSDRRMNRNSRSPIRLMTSSGGSANMMPPATATATQASRTWGAPAANPPATTSGGRTPLLSLSGSAPSGPLKQPDQPVLNNAYLRPSANGVVFHPRA